MADSGFVMIETAIIYQELTTFSFARSAISIAMRSIHNS